MAMETRQRGGLYYYRARKQGGRVLKQYAGAGLEAVTHQSIDRQLRSLRQAEADEKRAALAAFEAEEDPLADLCRRTELLARGVLLGAGYRQHHRGDWRRRRGE
jgi:hypothetical protein